MLGPSNSGDCQIDRTQHRIGCHSDLFAGEYVRFFVGITDRDWFDFLSSRDGLDEVNFWQPSGQQQFRALQTGEPFLFKLHSPDDYVVGGGFFSHFTILPASIVWQAFGEKNGARTEEEMLARIARYRRAPNPGAADDYHIGCILLESPFFFGRANWIPLPEWKREIVRGRGYDSEGDGKAIWERVDPLMTAPLLETETSGQSQPRYGDPVNVFPRLGQGSFRLIVTDSYDRRCAFTNSPVLHVLEAAHIRPYSLGGTHAPSNGILLRQDLHTLFDRGYMTVAPKNKLEISSRIKGEFHNGREYYKLHGKTMRLPRIENRQPSAEFLRWHNENIYRG
jgi:putative restriction endonuclease